jgi:hypothetical protein
MMKVQRLTTGRVVVAARDAVLGIALAVGRASAFPSIFTFRIHAFASSAD